jgi:hypothetical protein
MDNNHEAIVSTMMRFQRPFPLSLSHERGGPCILSPSSFGQRKRKKKRRITEPIKKNKICVVLKESWCPLLLLCPLFLFMSAWARRPLIPVRTYCHWYEVDYGRSGACLQVIMRRGKATTTPHNPVKSNSNHSFRTTKTNAAVSSQFID